MNVSLTDLNISTGQGGARSLRYSGLIRLVMWVVPVAILWLLVLPWLARRPVVADHIQWLDEHDVDASAMYYTELEVLKPVLDRLNVRGRIRQLSSKGINTPE
jgi:hypothetical protein